MKIFGVSSKDFVNIYNDNKKISKSREVEKVTDRVEISNVGKKLSNYSTVDSFGVSDEKLNSIKSEINQGTYNRDSKLVATKMVNAMKGREI